MSVPRYTQYKGSGVEWLGEVPAHWEAKKVKRLYNFVKRQDNADLPVLSVYRDYGVIDKSSRDDNNNKTPDDLSLYQTVRRGDLVINKMKAWQGSLGISSIDGITSPDYAVFEKMHREDDGFLHYLFRSPAMPGVYQAISNGIRPDQWRLEPDKFRQLELQMPPLSEQRAIATFLDRETGKIGVLVAEQEKLIELLKEKRQALISHAVTKGLDPTVPMKDSRIAWLGEIPAHWDTLRVKYLTDSIEQGWSPLCEGFPVESSDEWGVLKVGCVNGGVFNQQENKMLPEGQEPIPELGVVAGDLLISRANTRELVGSAAVALEDHPRLMLCDKLYRLRLNGASCLSGYLALFLGIGAARGQIELAATGASSSMLNIGQSTILEMPVPVPPLLEQQAIVGFLDTECGKASSLIAEAQRAIELLKERRSALISAAVTGKIDVRRLGQNEPSSDALEPA